MKPMNAKHEDMTNEITSNMLPEGLDWANNAAEVYQLRQLVQQQATQIAELERRTTEDGLTRLCNRRGFDKALDNALVDYHRYNRAAAVLLIDVNEFKSTNDTYGHAAGDAVLRHIAVLLKRFTRASDIVARLGGDEFAIILQEATPQIARDKARELEAQILSIPCEFNGRDFYADLSIGTCALCEGHDAAEVLSRADSEMYRRKQQFKNARRAS